MDLALDLAIELTNLVIDPAIELTEDVPRRLEHCKCLCELPREAVPACRRVDEVERRR